MSGIIHKAKSISLGSATGEPSLADHVESEMPTLADLLLPGTGHKFSDEFACLLRLLGEDGVPA